MRSRRETIQDTKGAIKNGTPCGRPVGNLRVVIATDQYSLSLTGGSLDSCVPAKTKSDLLRFEVMSWA